MHRRQCDVSWIISDDKWSILRHVQTTAGCDSIVETHLTVDSVIYSYDSLSICSGDSALIAGNCESTGGIYRDTLTAQAGCDSIAVMELTIIPALANTIESMGICTGDSAMLAGSIRRQVEYTTTHYRPQQVVIV